MNIEELNSELTVLADKKTELSKLNYDSEDYDHLEEELHALEDQFQEKYGDYLEEAISHVHDEYCPDNDVLLPIAYLANSYMVGEDKYDVDEHQGVLVEVDDYPGKKTRLVLVPKPTRLILQIDSDIREEVWKP